MSGVLILSLFAPAHADECVSVELSAAAAEAVELVIEDELDAASRAAWAGLGALECLERVPDPEDLATLWQVLGAIETYRGEVELAATHLARSAAVHPGWFNEQLGQDVQEAWAQATIALSDSAGLAVWPVPTGGLLLLDGVVRPPTPLDVAPGRHVVQVMVDDQLVYSLVLELADGQRAEIATGLPEPEVAGDGVSPWLVGAGVAALAAASSYGVAWTVDRRLPEAVTVEDLDRGYVTGRAVGYAVAGGLAGAAVVGAGVHIAVW